MKLSNSNLHYHALKPIVDTGTAPRIAAIAQAFEDSEAEVVVALKALQKYHGVVLLPVSLTVRQLPASRGRF